MGKLTSSRQFVVGLVMDFFRKDILEGAKSYAMEHGIRLDARWSVRGDWMPDRPGWDGVIYGIADNADLLKKLRSWEVAKVDVASEWGEYSVLHDYGKCAEMGVRELVDAGVDEVQVLRFGDKRIDRDCESIDLERLLPTGVVGRTVDLRGSWPDGLGEKMILLVRRAKGRIGFFLPHAAVAYLIEETLIAEGVRIPEDVCLAVIDKEIQQTAKLAPVPLSAVELNDWHCGYLAMELMHYQLKGALDGPIHMKLSPHGVKQRRSSGHLGKEDSVLAKALSFMSAHFHEVIGVDDVAVACGVSRRLVEIKFREVLNRGVRQELIRLRMEAAKKLLGEGEVTVTEVAERCGFTSVHYFSNAFKREEGVTPKRYQREHG